MNDQDRLLKTLLNSRSFQDFMAYNEAAYPDEHPEDPWLKRNTWRIASGIVFALMLALLLSPLPKGVADWLASYRGGLAINAATGVLFLFITLALDYRFTKQHERIEARVRALSASHYERQLKEQIEEFVRLGDWENIALLDRQNKPTGVELRVTPVRDAGGPFVRRDFSHVCYVVHVSGPASHIPCDPQNWAMPRDAELAKAFANSPVQSGQHHYIAFYSRRWHIGAGSLPGGQGWVPFHIAGKVSGAEFIESADKFVERERLRRKSLVSTTRADDC